MPAKMSLDEFVDLSREKHGNRYDYAQVEYVNSQTKVQIACHQHGVFEMKPNAHLNGQGCPACGRVSSNSSRTLTTSSFIRKAGVVHGDRYDYSKVVYTSSQAKVEIHCKEHGPFLMRPATHLSGQGCPKCGKQDGASLKRKSLDDFIVKSIDIHGDTYDYSLAAQPKNNKQLLTVLCKEHGPFSISRNSHLRGRGCPKCGTERSRIARRSTVIDFVSSAVKVHGELYDYSKVVYQGMSSKVVILCRACGEEFTQSPANHIRQKQGCPACGKLKSSNSRRKSQDTFISEATATHQGYYDYTQVDYRGAFVKVTITCPVHGPFLQDPASHLKGEGCRMCGIDRRAEQSRLTTEEFVNRAKKAHGNKFDYSETKYLASGLDITFRCQEHGVIHMLPHDHLNSVKGCPSCSHAAAGEIRRSSFSDFVMKALEVHGDRYEYDESSYVDSKTKTNIICKKHGVFQQSPNGHLGGHGCRSCAGSNGENEVADYLGSLGVELIRWDRSVLSGFELDFLMPNEKVAIEYNGLRYHSSWVEETRGRHWVLTHQKDKQLTCAANGIRLVHYYEDEWWDKKDIVKKQIALLLGKYSGPKVPARRTDLREVSWQHAAEFLSTHHLQGCGTVGKPMGLFYAERLVSVMVFSRVVSHRGEKVDPRIWELSRFASDGQVIGGASKLLTGFLRAHPGVQRIVSYSDNRWSTGGIYKTLGFAKTADVPPDYYYVKDAQRHHKSSFRRSLLAKKFPDQFDPTLSERENCHNLGFYQLFNCGLTKWSLDIT